LISPDPFLARFNQPDESLTYVWLIIRSRKERWKLTPLGNVKRYSSQLRHIPALYRENSYYPFLTKPVDASQITGYPGPNLVKHPCPYRVTRYQCIPGQSRSPWRAATKVRRYRPPRRVHCKRRSRGDWVENPPPRQDVFGYWVKEMDSNSHHGRGQNDPRQGEQDLSASRPTQLSSEQPKELQSTEDAGNDVPDGISEKSEGEAEQGRGGQGRGMRLYPLLPSPERGGGRIGSEVKRMNPYPPGNLNTKALDVSRLRHRSVSMMSQDVQGARETAQPRASLRAVGRGRLPGIDRGSRLPVRVGEQSRSVCRLLLAIPTCYRAAVYILGTAKRNLSATRLSWC